MYVYILIGQTSVHVGVYETDNIDSINIFIQEREDENMYIYAKCRSIWKVDMYVLMYVCENILIKKGHICACAKTYV